ncbi:MAG: hypothetical protein JWR44_3718 [Hymenobacter sp.]|nr:hypothetical protein [Hymenobacter sp.]
MTALENFVSPALTRALGWTLLHSLWQGALVAAVLAGALLLLRRQRAEVRYVASAGALGMIVALAGITFGLYLNAGAEKSVLPGSGTATTRWVPLRQAESTTLAPLAAPVVLVATPSLASPEKAGAKPAIALAPAARPNWLAAGLRYFDKNMPLLVVAWLLGLLAMSLRLLGGLLYVQRLRRYRVRPLGAAWQARLAALAARSGLKRPVALLESALVQVPLVVGHVRPVILLPLGAVAGLSPAYLEAILAHELAHVLRRDYLVNLLQTVAEALFFYHPAVWFVANCVRTERENCCDDTATALVGGDPMRLARALTALAEWSQSAVVPVTPQLALAALGGRDALLSRVRRLVQRRPAAPTLAEGLMAGALVLGGLGLLGGSVALAGPLAQPSIPAAKPAAFDWQTGPAKQAPVATVADTSKRAKNAAALSVQDAERAKTSTEQVLQNAEVAQARLGDTIRLRRPARVRTLRSRDARRIVVDGRNNGPAFPGGPSTVVVTKDKKGRLTELVVNGQRVETEAGKRKIKIKDKKGRADDGRQVEVIRVGPADDAFTRGFVYRSNGDTEGRELEKRFERDFKRGAEFRTREVNPEFRERFNRLYNVNPDVRIWTDGHQSGRTFRLAPGAFGPDPAGALRSQREALRTAERALREASAVKNLSADQRKRLNSRLDEVRAQLKATERNSASSARVLRLNGDQLEAVQGQDAQRIRERVRENVQNNLQDEIRDRQEEMRERQEELRERIRESQRELRELDGARSRNRSEDALVTEMVKDGLIKDRENFQFSLSARKLTVNGKEQSAKLLQKYLKLYETSTGRKMSATGAMTVSRNGSTSYNSDGPPPPAPPRPPRAPRTPRGLQSELTPLAPPAPPTMALPPPMAPPTPPAPPRLDTQELRSELRKDGLIGASDKSFQLQLNNSGMTVNGKRQPDEVAAKYRKLMGREDGTYNVNISSQE